MKKSDLKALINECIHEVLAEEASNTKTQAINEIKRIIAENELEEEEVEEGIRDIFKTKPATDEELNAWLANRPKIKAALDKMDQEKANKYKEYVKNKEAKSIKNDESITNVEWSDEKKEWGPRKSATNISFGGGLFQ